VIEQELIATFGFYYHQFDTIRDSSWLGTDNPPLEIYKSGLWNVDGAEGFPSLGVVSKVEEYTKMTNHSEDTTGGYKVRHTPYVANVQWVIAAAYTVRIDD
jgi:hypothetical protein